MRRHVYFHGNRPVDSGTIVQIVLIIVDVDRRTEVRLKFLWKRTYDSYIICV